MFLGHLGPAKLSKLMYPTVKTGGTNKFCRYIQVSELPRSMVVHRGNSWDASADTSHRQTLQILNQNTLHTTDADGTAKYKTNTEDHHVEWVSYLYKVHVLVLFGPELSQVLHSC